MCRSGDRRDFVRTATRSGAAAETEMNLCLSKLHECRKIYSPEKQPD